MKWSKYNFIVDNGDGKQIIYNCSTDKLMVVLPQIKDLIMENVYKLNELKKIHPDLFTYLKSNSFILRKNANEEKAAVQRLQEQDSTAEVYELIINPTMDCNLRCWYCYEEHSKGSCISCDTLLAIKKFIKKQIDKKELKLFILSFFGGEPFLKYHEVIEPLIRHTSQLCKERKIEIQLNFTTNAILMTEDICESLAGFKLSTYIQVPFDGGEQLHNKIKKIEDSTGAYRITLNNILTGLKYGFQYNIRCNYSSENVIDFHKLIQDLKPLFKDYGAKINVSFQRIWQKTEDENTLIELSMYETVLKESGISFDSSGTTLSTRCYSDRENSVLINYNGDIYKCSARDFMREAREGVLLSDGSIKFNSRYRERLKAKFNFKKCRQCNILPVCDVCSQKKLEAFDDNICLRMATDHDKSNLIKSRIQVLSTGNIS